MRATSYQSFIRCCRTIAWLIPGPRRSWRGLLLCGWVVLLAGPAFAQVSFTPIASQPPDNIYSIVADPNVPGTLYACCGSAVVKSINEGSTWTYLASSTWQNLNVLYITATGQLYAGAEKSFVGTGGVFKYSAGSWTLMPGSPLDVSALVLDPSNGHLFAGTGYTNNPIIANVQPINFGTGVWEYNGTTWAQIKTSIYPASPTSVSFFIKALVRLPSGEIIAATYGNGVLKYASGSWTAYGTGLGNLFVNCLATGPGGELYAGTDNGVYVSTGGGWTAVQTGLPAKPVRALVYTGGKLIAGLGYFQYQTGGIQGELYQVTLGAGTWATAGTGFNSTSVLSLVATTNKVLTTACGIWARPLAGSTWTCGMSGVKLPNRVFQLAHNSQGHLFAMCSNQGRHGSSPATGFGFGGVFRSTDNGATWVSINNGINYPSLMAILVDDKDNLWLTARKFKGSSSTKLWSDPELYKSTDNGTSWIKNTTISATATEEDFPFMAQAPSGRLYVAHGLSAATIVSATDDYGLTFDNTLTVGQGPTAPSKAFGLSINAASDVFVGSEVGGILRSTSNGAAGSFVEITDTAPNAPVGNNAVYVDPYIGTVFSSGTKGRLGGVIPSGSNYHNYYSLPADNGGNMFQFNGLADNSSFEAMICDNRGNFYGNLNTPTRSSSLSGVYMASPPFTSSTVFKLLGGGFSYHFKSFMMDDCGYLYGTDVSNGANIYKSTAPVNKPFPSQLVTPASGTLNVPTGGQFKWTSNCASNTYQLQISTDVAFSAPFYSKLAISGTSFTPPAGTLLTGKHYYWRLQSTNPAGTSAWSDISNFATPGGALPVTLVSFSAVPDGHWPRINLAWQTTANSDAPYYAVQKSTDGHTFEHLARVSALPNTSGLTRYSALDEHPTDGTSYYRLSWPGNSGSPEFSAVAAVRYTPNSACYSVAVNAADGLLVVTSFCEHSGLQVQVLSLAGSLVASSRLPAWQRTAAIPLARFSSGAYLVRIQDDNGRVVSTTKVVVD